MIGIIYVKRRQRLRLLHGPGSGIITPLKLPKLVSQLRTPPTKSVAITFPPAQLRSPHGPKSTQSSNIRRRDDSEGRDTLADAVEQLQERVAHLEGRSSGERAWYRRLRRASTPGLREEAARSESTLDPPPTYNS